MELRKSLQEDKDRAAEEERKKSKYERAHRYRWFP
jgi:hypothetical protein